MNTQVNLFGKIDENLSESPLEKFFSSSGISSDKNSFNELQFFEKTFLNHPSIILLIDPLNGKIVFGNLAAAEFYGYSLSQIKGISIKKINALSDKETSKEVRSAKLEKRDYYVFTHKTSSGKKEQVEVRSAPITLNDQQFLLFIVSVLKKQTVKKVIFSKKEVTRHIPITLDTSSETAQLAFDLESVEKRTRELLRFNEKLIESQNKLKKLNANKDRFFSIISHDLRNQFMSILGFTQMLKDIQSDFDKEEIILISNKLYKSTRNTFALLENLLEWSSLQRDTIEFIAENFNLKEVVDEVIVLLKERAVQKGIDLISNVNEDISIFADQNMIKTVLRNLISNALKFTSKNGSIFVEAETGDKTVNISVLDTGVGISEENIKELFRIDKKHSTNGTDGERGTGVGLILCKEFVEKNKGKIWVKSKIGHGSKFTFNLPVEKS